MKKVFFGLMMMVFASSAYASVPIATVDNVSLDIAKIELSSDGVISVTLRKTKEVVAKAIAPANFNLLNSDSNIRNSRDPNLGAADSLHDHAPAVAARSERFRRRCSVPIHGRA